MNYLYTSKKMGKIKNLQLLINYLIERYYNINY